MAVDEQPIKKYLAFVFLIFFVTFGIYFIEVFFLEAHQGSLMGAVEVSLDLFMFYFLHRKSLLEKEKKGDYQIKWFFLFLGMADFFYAFFYYFLNLSSRTFWSTVIIASLYNIAYFFGAFSLLRLSTPRPFKNVNKLFYVFYAACLPAASGLLMMPFLRENAPNLTFDYVLLELFSVVSMFFLLAHAVVTLISNMDYFWNNVSAGMAMLVISDWALRVEKLIDEKPKFGFYEALYCLGIFTMFISINRMKQISPVEPRSSNSLIAKVKAIVFVATFSSIISLSLSQYGSKNAIRFSIVGLILGIYLVVLIGLYLKNEFDKFSGKIAEISGNSELDTAAREQEIARHLPAELVVPFNETVAMQIRNFKDKNSLVNENLLQKKYTDLAAQVSHDIRSPLAALEMISSTLQELSEEKRLIIKNSVNRIRDIANDLISGHKKSLVGPVPEPVIGGVKSEEFSTNLLAPLIEAIVTEKRIQYRNSVHVHVDFDQTRKSYGLFGRIQPTEFKRMLSNLIGNSAEALQGEGYVTLALQADPAVKDVVQLVIKDDGKGIPAEVLPKLGIRGGTHGKEDGSGLGLFHAKETMKACDGSMEIISGEGSGATVTLSLPRQPAPAWFVPEILLSPKQTVVIFDDDQTVHQIWRGRIGALSGGADIQLHSFSDTQTFRNYFGQNFSDLDKALFLMDYEILGKEETGLDLIELLGIQDQAILVTSRYEESALRVRCEKLKVKLIPKPMCGFVPMEIR